MRPALSAAVWPAVSRTTTECRPHSELSLRPGRSAGRPSQICCRTDEDKPNMKNTFSAVRLNDLAVKFKVVLGNG